MSIKQTDLITSILGSSKIIAVVGLSSKTSRPSHGVAAYMQAHGYRIIPVNPREAGNVILGEYCYPDLITAAAEHRIDIVDCFRNAADIPPIVEEAIQIAAPYLWMQSGIVNEAAAARAEAAGIKVVMDRCIKIEHLYQH
ncbi:CoA-binding protein [Undibacterium sp. Ji83W]|uniref:CoA-binding protein n=1 Tax=Undibacterium sp. Ji83W TaxID=3413043 RepID=UPI003BF1CD08